MAGGWGCKPGERTRRGSRAASTGWRPFLALEGMSTGRSAEAIGRLTRGLRDGYLGPIVSASLLLPWETVLSGYLEPTPIGRMRPAARKVRASSHYAPAEGLAASPRAGSWSGPYGPRDRPRSCGQGRGL